MDLNVKLNCELKQKDPNSRISCQHQLFAETAANALEHRTFLDVDSEP
jgi:hypothetical protein